MGLEVALFPLQLALFGYAQGPGRGDIGGRRYPDLKLLTGDGGNPLPLGSVKLAYLEVTVGVRDKGIRRIPLLRCPWFLLGHFLEEFAGPSFRPEFYLLCLADNVLAFPGDLGRVSVCVSLIFNLDEVAYIVCGGYGRF